MSTEVQDAAKIYLETVMSRLKEQLGIDEIISACEVLDMDPFAAGTIPRRIRVLVNGYPMYVWWRGSPSLAVGEYCSVLHLISGNLYEILGASGPTGVVPSVAMATARGDMIAADASLDWVRLPLGGAANSVLTRTATDPAWSTGTLVFGGAASSLTLPNAATTITGGGTLALGGFVLTVPLTGTAALGAGTLTVSSINNVGVASHTHAITSSSNPGAAASLLASDASGYLILTGLGIGAGPSALYRIIVTQVSTDSASSNIAIFVRHYDTVTAGINTLSQQAFGATTRVSVSAGASLTGTAYGFLGGAYIQPANAGAITQTIGLSSYNFVSAGAAGTLGLCVAVGATLDAGGANTLAITEFNSFRAYAPSVLNTVGTLYGLRVGDMSIGSVANYAIATGAGNVVFNDDADANTDFRHEGSTDPSLLFSDAGLNRVGINRSVPAGKLDVYQAVVDAAIPVLKLEQKDVSEEFIRYVGTAAAGVLTQSIVDEGDQASETREGWIKMYVVDDGDQVVDGPYHVPFYTLNA